MKGGNIVKKNIVGLLIILLCFFASCRTEEPILPEEPALPQVSTLPEDITEIPPYRNRYTKGIRRWGEVFTAIWGML